MNLSLIQIFIYNTISDTQDYSKRPVHLITKRNCLRVKKPYNIAFSCCFSILCYEITNATKDYGNAMKSLRNKEGYHYDLFNNNILSLNYLIL